MRTLLTGLRGEWADQSPEAVTDFLQAFRDSSSGLKTSIYKALHDLSLAVFYSSLAGWAATQYPGPPITAA